MTPQKLWYQKNRERVLRLQRERYKARNVGASLPQDAQAILATMTHEQRLRILCRVCEEIHRRKELVKYGIAGKNHG